MNKTAFIFPGQGSQYEGMIEPVRDFQITQYFLDEFQKILGYRFEDLTNEEMLPTNITQPVLFTVSCIYFEILKEKGYKPFILAGHSLGEYSALYAAGFFTYKTGLQIVTARGLLMSQINQETPGKMAALIGSNETLVKEICIECSKIGVCESVNYNSLEQTIISGQIEAIDFACKMAKEKGIKLVIPLQVSAPFHSSLMQKMAVCFSDELDHYRFETPKIPIVQNFDANVHQEPTRIKKNLVLQLDHPVMWRQSIEELMNRGVKEIVEVGPKKVLTGLLKKTNVKALAAEDLMQIKK